MLSQSQSTKNLDLNKLLALEPWQWANHLEIAFAIRDNLGVLLEIYNISKKEIMTECGLSQDQYYRRMSGKKWDLENLRKIIKLIVRKQLEQNGHP